MINFLTKTLIRTVEDIYSANKKSKVTQIISINIY
jgi:hypothetical protein